MRTAGSASPGRTGRRRVVPLLALAALAALGGCATRAWVVTRTANTLFAYETFLKRHPRSRYAVEAWARLDSLLLADGASAGDFRVYEQFFARCPVGRMGGRDRERMQALYFDRARRLDCPFAYEAFLKAFPAGDRAAAAAADTAALRRHLRALERAAGTGLPQGARYRVERRLGPAARAEYTVTLALVPGRSPDDGNPGHYFGTPQILARAVTDRCLGVVRAAARSAALPPGEGLVLRVRHGVGVESMGFTSSRGRAMTIYEVAVPAAALTADLAAEADAAVAAQWELRRDLLPELRSGSGSRRRQ